MSDLPPPLVPDDIDLRDYPYTPIFRARLFGSEFHAVTNGEEWRAGVTLWLKSWDQVPAGTLPADDVSLCRLAELGRDLRTWTKVKGKSLHGWVLCSDNRLHHPVVAEIVLETQETRKKRSARGHAGAIARWKKINGSSNAQASKLNAQAMLGDATEGKGREGTLPLAKANGSHAPGDPWKEVYDYGKNLLGQSAGGIITNLRKVYDDKPRKVLAKLQDAAEVREPASWLNAFLQAHAKPGMHVGAAGRVL